MAPSAPSAGLQAPNMALDGSEISKGPNQTIGAEPNFAPQSQPSPIDYGLYSASANGASSSDSLAGGGRVKSRYAGGGDVTAPVASAARDASIPSIPTGGPADSYVTTSPSSSQDYGGYELGPYRDWAIQVGRDVGAFKAHGGPINTNHQMAAHLASQGRGRDSTLVHMSPKEVNALGKLHPTGQIPINPKTGLPEADFLTDILPGIAGTLVGSVVGMPWLGAAIGGLGTWAATGNLGKGILSGLLSFGLGSLGGQLAGAGAEAAGEVGAKAAGDTAAKSAIDLAQTTGEQSLSKATMGTEAAQLAATGPGMTPAGWAAGQTTPAAGEGLFGRISQGFQNAPQTMSNIGQGIMNPQNLDLGKMVTPGIMAATGIGGLMASNQPPAAMPTPASMQRQAPPPLTNAATPPRTPTGFVPPPGYGTSAYPMEGSFFQPNPAWSGYPSLAAKGGQMRVYETPHGGQYELAKGGVAELPSGMIRGPGAGMDDKIKGTIDGRRDVYLSDGEYVVDAQTVSALGDGSSEAGAKRMKNIVEEIRQKKFGSKKQPAKINMGGIASIV